MDKSHERLTVTNNFADSPAQAHHVGARFGSAPWLVGFVIAAVALAAWFVSSVGVPHVSAAAGDESATFEVPYFPAQYKNQATEPSSVPATF